MAPKKTPQPKKPREVPKNRAYQADPAYKQLLAHRASCDVDRTRAKRDFEVHGQRTANHAKRIALWQKARGLLNQCKCNRATQNMSQDARDEVFAMFSTLVTLEQVTYGNMCKKLEASQVAYEAAKAAYKANEERIKALRKQLVAAQPPVESPVATPE